MSPKDMSPIVTINDSVPSVNPVRGIRGRHVHFISGDSKNYIVDAGNNNDKVSSDLPLLVQEDGKKYRIKIKKDAIQQEITYTISPQETETDEYAEAEQTGLQSQETFTLMSLSSDAGVPPRMIIE
jgi:hypothetical protein